jgi:hypothetical protein
VTKATGTIDRRAGARHPLDPSLELRERSKEAVGARRGIEEGSNPYAGNREHRTFP